MDQHLSVLRNQIASQKLALLESYTFGTPADRLRDVLEEIDYTLLARLIRVAHTGRDYYLGVRERKRIQGTNIALGLVLTEQALSTTVTTRKAPSGHQRIWADKMLNLVGELAHIEYYLSFVDTGMGVIHHKSDLSFDIVVSALNAGVEAVEREYIIRQFEQSRGRTDIVDLEAKRTAALRYLHSLHNPGNLRNLRIHSSPLLNDYYYSLGQREVEEMIGQDVFDAASCFGGIEFGVYRRVLSMLVGLAHEHVDLSLSVDPYGKREWCAPTVKMQDLVARIARATGITPMSVSSVMPVFTLTSENVSAHCRVPDAAWPPLVAVGGDRVVLSLAGCYVAPVEFMLAELRRRYCEDWDRAGDDRERMWRPELYNLFTRLDSSRFITAPKGIKVRESKRIVTDIDAVVFDPTAGTLGLFQLKWQDLFARDMYKRSSRMRNFLPTAHKWIEDTADWLSRRSAEEICSTLGIKQRFASAIKHFELFVLGRYSAHFSGQPRPDLRAAWGTWAQVELLARSPDYQSSTDFKRDPLSWLAAKMRLNTPFDLANTDVQPEELKLGESTLVVKLSDTDTG